MKRSKQNLGHYTLASFNQGDLIPCGLWEVLPGDTFRHKTQILMRITPLVTPVMHPIYVRVHHFFCPSRLLWNGWEDFITGNNQKTIPTMDAAQDATAKLLAQYMGAGVEVSAPINALPFRMYRFIYNEFFRDQDIQDKLTVELGDGPDDPTGVAIKDVNWEKDYFTTCRPYPQQDEDMEVIPVTMPDGSPAPIAGLGQSNPEAQAAVSGTYRTSDGQQTTFTGRRVTSSPSSAGQGSLYVEDSNGYPNIRVDQQAGITPENFRRHMARQKWREHRNRFGSRYTDLLRALGVTPGDSRLDRPEYLGGGRQVLSVSEVLSTAEAGARKVGDLAGHGLSVISTRPYKKFFPEHGFVMSLISVRPKTVYQQNVPRQWLRNDRWDYWHKETEMEGSQPVTNLEVFSQHTDPQGTFGWQQRHEEYRRFQSYVAGRFRDSTMDSWHMARKWSSDIALNDAFITADPTNRIYATTATDELQAMVGHRLSARRLVSRRARHG